MRYRQALAAPDLCLQPSDIMLFLTYFCWQKHWVVECLSVHLSLQMRLCQFWLQILLWVILPHLEVILSAVPQDMQRLGVIIEEKLAEKCNLKSALFKEKLKHPLISEVRGEGLLLAIQLTDRAYVPYIVANAHRYGLIIDFFLFCDSALRLAPPLIITEDEIILACKLLLDLLDDASENAIRK